MCRAYGVYITRSPPGLGMWTDWWCIVWLASGRTFRTCRRVWGDYSSGNLRIICNGANGETVYTLIKYRKYIQRKDVFCKSIVVNTIYIWLISHQLNRRRNKISFLYIFEFVICYQKHKIKRIFVFFYLFLHIRVNCRSRTFLCFINLNNSWKLGFRVWFNCLHYMNVGLKNYIFAWFINTTFNNMWKKKTIFKNSFKLYGNLTI